MTKNTPAIMAALILSGCIFESDTGHSFDVGFYADLGPVNSYQANGTVDQSLGFGATVTGWVEGESSDTGIVQPVRDDWPLLFGPPQDDPWTFYSSSDTLDTSGFDQDSDEDESALLLQITPDTTRVMRVSDAILLPSFETVVSYPGMPCTFSRLRGSVWDSAHGETAVVIKSVRFQATADDTLRLALLIDTAASKAAAPGLVFSGKAFYGKMRVSCP